MKILSANIKDDYQTWLDIWKGWDGKEIFAHPDYLNLFDDYSEPLCAVLSMGDLMVIYPFCLRNLYVEFNEHHDCNECKDIISPYGYGGLYLIGDGDFNPIMDEFYLKFEKWAISQNVISEFIRFDLFSKSRDKYNGEVSHNNENIVCDLRKGKDQLWKEFKPKVRNNVRKGIKNDLSLTLDFDGNHIEEFLDIYYGTMDRLKANEKYYFKRDFFERIHNNLKGHFVYFYAKKGNQILSADLVLISENKIYSFLSATNRDAFQYRPNDFVKYHIIQWGVDGNKDYYVLGGGHKLLDSLFSYKKSFAPEGIVPFYVGKKIFNNKLYRQLVELNEKKIFENLDVLNRNSDFFPLYRLHS